MVGYPEEMCKSEDYREGGEDEEDEEEEEAEVGMGEILEQPMSGEVLSTHHLVYGEDGQVNK